MCIKHTSAAKNEQQQKKQILEKNNKSHGPPKFHTNTHTQIHTLAYKNVHIHTEGIKHNLK